MEDDATTESDDGSTLAVDVLHMVDVLGCLNTFLLYPFLDGLAQTRGINEAGE